MDKSIHDAFATAIENGDEEAAKRLLTAHPDLVDGPNWTPPPLHCTVLWDRPRIAKLLLEHSADLEQRDPDQGTTPLRYAVVFAKPDLVRLFLEHGANVGKLVDHGSTALELAEEAARGAYEEFEDMPSREVYEPIIQMLRTT